MTTTFLGTELPIIQAPMAGVQGSTLAVAVSNAGGLGSLPSALFGIDTLRAELAALRAQAAGPYNVNFFCHEAPTPSVEREAAWRTALAPYYAEYGVDPPRGPTGPGRMPFGAEAADLLDEFRPAVVSFHFGLPEAPLLERVKASGAPVIGNATTVAEARWLAERGVDAIIAQGFEAGGHTGRFLGSDPAEAMGLFALLPQVADAVSVPVIAAGGIADGRGIAAALTLGASAVQLGTAYLHSPETPISDAHRAALRGGATLFTNLMTGGLARGLHGRLVDELGAVRAEAPPYPLASAALAPIRAVAERQCEYGFGPMWAGQAAALGSSLPAAELTRRLAAEALAIITGER